MFVGYWLSAYINLAVFRLVDSISQCLLVICCEHLCLTGPYFQTADWNQAVEKDGMERGTRHWP